MDDDHFKYIVIGLLVIITLMVWFDPANKVIYEKLIDVEEQIEMIHNDCELKTNIPLG